MINDIQQHNSVAKDTGTVNKIVDPTTKSHNTTRQSTRPHKHIRHTVRWQGLPDHFKRRPHPIPPISVFYVLPKKLIKAIKNNQLTTWTGLTETAVDKYFPDSSPETDKSHMKR